MTAMEEKSEWPDTDLLEPRPLRPLWAALEPKMCSGSSGRFTTRTGQSLCSIAAFVVGGRRGGTSAGPRSALGCIRPTTTGDRIRSAPGLVTSSCWLGRGPLGSSPRRGAGFVGGGGQRPAFTRRYARQERNFGCAARWRAINMGASPADTCASVVQCR